jgi:hypothetical protein
MIRSCLFFLFIFLTLSAEATALFYGGEITWECMPNGRYRFKMRVYQDCYQPSGSAPAMAGTQQIVSTGGGVSSIAMTLVNGYPRDVSPQCNAILNLPQLNCTGMQNATSGLGAIREYYYTSDYAAPTGVLFTGVPPAAGWTFSWTLCCRTPSTNIPSSSNQYTLKSKMYSYNNQNVYPCFDWSPRFAEIPTAVITAGYPFQLNQFVNDHELDSLVFEWAEVLMTATTTVPLYAPGYSYNSPLPGVTHHPNNIPATIDPHTGAIRFKSLTSGDFVLCVKIASWKCNKKVAEIWREFRVIIRPAINNIPPSFSGPFPFPDTSTYQYFTDTVYAGELVNFSITGVDLGFHPGIYSWQQFVTLTAIGSQFGLNFTNSTTGCIQPPCATLFQPLPRTAPVAVQTQFNWQTVCDHLAVNLGCGKVTNAFDFYFIATDDYCPVPAQSTAHIRIVVVPKPPLDSPKPLCSRVMPDGSVKLSWFPVSDTLNRFQAYVIYKAKSPSGPFLPLDSLLQITADEYFDTTAVADTGAAWYLLKTKMRCTYDHEYSAATDTLVSIRLKAPKVSATQLIPLSWNAADKAGMGTYHVFRAPQGSSFAQIASTSGLYYTDTIFSCSTTYRYKLEYNPGVLSQFSCVFESNFVEVTLNDSLAPDAVVFDTLSYIPINELFTLSWSPSQAQDLAGYLIYRQSGGSFGPVDTLLGPHSSYTDLAANACSGGGGYFVSPFDACGNAIAASIPVPVFEMNAAYQPLMASVQLSWQPPLYQIPDVSVYTVYRMKDYQGWTEYVSLAGNSFQHNFPDPNSVYCYFVRAYNAVKQRSVSSCPVCVVTGTYQGLEASNNFVLPVIFPNPTKEEWRVVFGREERNIRIELYDVSGRRVLAIDKAAAGRGEEVLVSAAHLPEGVYLMRIQTEQQQHRKVVLINK